MLLQIAWRNLFRNRLRTLLTVLAVAGGLVGMLAMESMMRAMGDRMLEALVGSSGGHIQIHREGYRTDQQFTLTVRNADELLRVVRETDGVEGASGRIYGFAHASFVRGADEAVRSGGGEEVGAPVVAIFGIDPEHELDVTDMNERVSEGRWLRGETEVLIGDTLAERNNIEIGDAMLPTTVAATGAMQGPWAVSDEVPRVVGFIHTGVDDIDSRMVIMNLDYVEQLVRLEGQVHEVAIRAQDAKQLTPVVESLRERVSEFRSRVVAPDTLPATKALPIGVQTPDGDPPAAGSPSLRLVGITIDPQAAERRPESLSEGRFLQRAEDILLPAGLAKQLDVSAGDRVTVGVPIDCGEGIPAEQCPPSAESFLVAGIFPSDDAELAGVGLVASTVVTDNVVALAPTVSARLGESAAEPINALLQDLSGTREARDEILPWDEINPAVAQMMTMMETAPLIFLIIIYFAVVLGIANTMLMATFERMREFGILRAVGMRPLRVVAMVIAESGLLSLVGVGLGLAIGIPLLLYWQAFGLDTGVFMEGDSYNIAGVNFDPMLWPSIKVAGVIEASIAVSVLTTLAGLWPAFRAARIQPTEALRHD